MSGYRIAQTFILAREFNDPESALQEADTLSGNCYVVDEHGLFVTSRRDQDRTRRYNARRVAEAASLNTHESDDTP